MVGSDSDNIRSWGRKIYFVKFIACFHSMDALQLKHLIFSLFFFIKEMKIKNSYESSSAQRAFAKILTAQVAQYKDFPLSMNNRRHFFLSAKIFQIY